MIYKTNAALLPRVCPLRWAELGTVYRYEKSRRAPRIDARARFSPRTTPTSSCTPDQIEAEILRVIDCCFSLSLLKAFGFDRHSGVYLSTRDDKKKAVGDVASVGSTEAQGPCD